MFTQPLMYKRIQKQEQVLNSYSKKLIAEGAVTKDEVQVGDLVLFSCSSSFNFTVMNEFSHYV